MQKMSFCNTVKKSLDNKVKKRLVDKLSNTLDTKTFEVLLKTDRDIDIFL